MSEAQILGIASTTLNSENITYVRYRVWQNIEKFGFGIRRRKFTDF